MITGNRNVDFVSVAPFEVNDEKIISAENVVNAITSDFPRKILRISQWGRDLPSRVCRQ